MSNLVMAEMEVGYRSAVKGRRKIERWKDKENGQVAERAFANKNASPKRLIHNGGGSAHLKHGRTCIFATPLLIPKPKKLLGQPIEIIHIDIFVYFRLSRLTTCCFGVMTPQRLATVLSA